MTLLTMPELNAWVTSEDVPADSEWGLICITAASDLVRSAANQPTWTRDTAPARARQIASHLAARSYINPESISTDGALGPLGGDRRVEELSKAMHLTESERLELDALSPGGGSLSGRGSMWVQPLDGATLLPDDTIYAGTIPESDWMIPYLAADDVLVPQA